MNNKTLKARQQGHHDDCDDCKRERKQNQALIAIYERLQLIDNNSKIMRKSLDKHKQQFEKTNKKFIDFVNKVNNIPKQSKTDLQLKNLGNQIALAMMYQLNNGAIARQNQQLKNTLVRLYRPKNQFLNNLSSSARRSLSVSTDNAIESKDMNTYRNDESATQKSLCNKSFLKYQSNNTPIQQKKEAKQMEEDTRTTGFFSLQNNVKKQKMKIDGLNLWLYQQNKNKNLQKQLYETRIPTRYKLNKTKKAKGAILPALKTTRGTYNKI